MKIRNGFVSNSSTSSFICDVKMSEDEARDIMERIIEFHNEMFSNSRCDKKSCFVVFTAGEEFAKDMMKTWDHWEDCTGKLVIQGTDDNSIPFDMFDTIQARFQADRIHMG